MKNTLALLTLSLLASQAMAFTEIRWLPLDQQALVRLRNAGDDDCSKIYELMNVAPEQTASGNGKTFSILDDSFTLVCDEKGTICEMVFIKRPGIQISRKLGKIELVLNGSTAQMMRDYFNLDQNGAIDFESIDSRLFIKSYPQYIQILVQEK